MRHGELLNRHGELLYQVHEVLKRELPNHRPVEILEAGGGSGTYFKLDQPHEFTVIDINPEQLSLNKYASKTILGDLENPEAIKGKFDLIVCNDVLEHLRFPAKAFNNLVSSLAEGGLLFIGAPQLYSTKGLVTRLTPLSFHIWFHTVIRGDPTADGKEGRGPFPTYLRREMVFSSVIALGRSKGLVPLLAEVYPGPAGYILQDKYPWLYRLYDLPGSISRFLSGGSINLSASDYIVLFQKPAPRR